MNKIIAILIMVVLTVNAQTPARRGIFLHGYGSEGAEWVATGTPLALSSQAGGDGTFNSVYTPDLPGLDNLAAIESTLFPYFDDRENDSWIIIGHSLGGIAAKSIEPLTRDGNNNNIPELTDLRGIVTLGAPFQGAPIANSVHTNAQAEIDDFQNDLEAGPDWQVSYGWLGLSVPEVAISAAGWTVGKSLYEDFGSTLGMLNDELGVIITGAVDGNAGLLLGDNGIVVQQLNLINTLTPHLSIAGVENFPAAIRFASTVPPADEYFTDESEAVQLYNMAKTGYSLANIFHENEEEYAEWQAAVYFAMGFSPCGGYCFAMSAYWTADALVHNTGRYKWKRGADALNNIDDRWASLHNADVVQSTSSYMQDFWEDCGTGSPPGGWSSDMSIEDLEAMFLVTGCTGETLANGGFWDRRRVYYTVTVPEKSDGFIPVNRTRWNGTDQNVTKGNTSSNGSSVLNKNIYFDGTGEADGGYNHSELRNLTRPYGTGGPSMPMKYGREWIRTRLGVE